MLRCRHLVISKKVLDYYTIYYMRRDSRSHLTRNWSYDAASVRSTSCFAICHASCWTISVVLGISAIWIHRQLNDIPAGSFFGLVGIATWGSFPYALSSIFCVAAAKRKTSTTVTWLCIMSVASLTCSICIFAYSCMSIVIDSSLGTSTRLVTVAAVLCGISLVETITALLCCISCCTALGRGGRIGIGDRVAAKGIWDNEEEPHVTVMALPAGHALELFYAMYKPHLSTSGGLRSNAEGFDRVNRHFPVSRHQSYAHRHDLPPQTDGDEDGVMRESKQRSRRSRRWDGAPDDKDQHDFGDRSSEVIESLKQDETKTDEVGDDNDAEANEDSKQTKDQASKGNIK